MTSLKEENRKKKTQNKILFLKRKRKFPSRQRRRAQRTKPRPAQWLLSVYIQQQPLVERHRLFVYFVVAGSGGGGGFQSRFFRQREILHARTYCTRPKVTNQRGKKKTAGEGNVLRKSDWLRENWITQLQRAEKAQRILIDYSNEWAPTRWKTKNFEFLSCENNVEYWSR